MRASPLLHELTSAFDARTSFPLIVLGLVSASRRLDHALSRAVDYDGGPESPPNPPGSHGINGPRLPRERASKPGGAPDGADGFTSFVLGLVSFSTRLTAALAGAERRRAANPPLPRAKAPPRDLLL